MLNNTTQKTYPIAQMYTKTHNTTTNTKDDTVQPKTGNHPPRIDPNCITKHLKFKQTRNHLYSKGCTRYTIKM